MKKFLTLSVLFLALFSVALYADTIHTLTFETSGGYTTEDGVGNTNVEFSDGGYDFFTSTLENAIGSGYGVTGYNGSYYFAAQDMDGEGMTLPGYLYLNDVDISGYSNLGFEIMLAEDDYDDPKWDEANDYLHIAYRIDDGAWQELLWVESELSSGYNGEPRIDTDFDGVGDGTEITEPFQNFTESISGTGSSLDIRLEFSLNSGGEDIAVDDIKVTGTPAGGVEDPGNFAATTVSSSQIDLSWTLNGNSDNVMVAYNTSATFGTPSGSYSVGDPISGGGTVIYQGTNTSYNHTGLAEDTHYYYKAWSVDGSTQYSSGVTDDAKTYMTVPELYINEILASNSTTNQDDAGDYDDWFEIYNPGTSAVDIGGMYVTDNLAQPALYQIPADNPSATTIPAGGFILIWADNEDSEGELHTTFTLNAGGEAVGLFGSDGETPVDSYTFGAQTTDVSEGRETDGGATWVFFNIPTPQASNEQELLKVTSPNGGESWMQGSSKEITWASQNFTGNVKIELFHNSAYTTLAASTENDGSWTWDIPSDQELGTDYLVKVSDAADGDPADESDAAFSIIEPGYEPQLGDVVINEIMYDSFSSTDEEWIELYNTTDEEIDLSGWYITDDDVYPAAGEGDVVIPDGTTIASGAYLVISWTDLTGISGEVICDPASGTQGSGPGLGNSGDNIALYSSATGGTLIDGSLTDYYPDKSTSNTGASIERQNPSFAWSDAASWDESTNNYGGTEHIYCTPAAQNSNFVNSITGNDGALVNGFRLYANYPNPFNPSTTLRYEIPLHSGNAELTIFDILGKKVRTLAAGNIEAGQHQVSWDGRSDAGRPMPSGVYFARLKADGFSQTIKMILAK